MKNVCIYDPIVDIHPVEKFGFVNLRDCFVNSSVPSDISVDPLSFNGVEDPGSLLGRPSDIFDAYRRADYVQGASTKSNVPTSDGVSE